MYSETETDTYPIISWNSSSSMHISFALEFNRIRSITNSNNASIDGYTEIYIELSRNGNKMDNMLSLYHNEGEFVVKLADEYFYIDTMSVLPALTECLRMIYETWYSFNTSHLGDVIEKTGGHEKIKPPKCLDEVLRYTVIGMCVIDKNPDSAYERFIPREVKYYDGYEEIYSKICFDAYAFVHMNWCGDVIADMFNRCEVQNTYNAMMGNEYTNYNEQPSEKLYKNAYFLP